MVYGYASDEIYGIYGTLHGKREYPLHILGEFLQKGLHLNFFGFCIYLA